MTMTPHPEHLPDDQRAIRRSIAINHTLRLMDHMATQLENIAARDPDPIIDRLLTIHRDLTEMHTLLDQLDPDM